METLGNFDIEKYSINMKAFRNFDIKKHISQRVDQAINSAQEAKFISNQLLETNDFDFIIDIMKRCPILATAIIFRSCHSLHEERVIVYDEIIPRIRKIESEVTFLDPTIFSIIPPERKTSWTLNEIIIAAEFQVQNELSIRLGECPMTEEEEDTVLVYLDFDQIDSFYKFK